MPERRVQILRERYVDRTKLVDLLEKLFGKNYSFKVGPQCASLPRPLTIIIKVSDGLLLS